MKPFAIALAVIGLVIAGTPTGARADDAAVALDYHSKVAGCPKGDRVADEVAAKVGFVPWDPQAPVAIRVRVSQDSDDVVGSIELPDGASKIVRARTCPDLGEKLVSALAVAVDRGTTVGVGVRKGSGEERRLQRLEREAPARGDVQVKFRPIDDRKLKIGWVAARTTMTSQAGGYVYGAQLSRLEELCDAPCTAELPAGKQLLVVRDMATDFHVETEANLRRDTTLYVEYVSNAGSRKARRRATITGLVVGGLLGVVGSSLLVGDGPLYLHVLLAPAGFATGMWPGAIVGAALGPTARADEVRMTSRKPSLTLASGTF